jgi:hypothetical protein
MKNLYNRRIIISIFILLFIFSPQLSAQVSSIISTVHIGDAKEKIPLSISAELFSTESITGIFTAFRSFGQTEFTRGEMLIAGNTASITIPGAVVQPPFIEYYLIISMKDGSSQTYPVGIEQGVVPLQVPVSAVSEKDKEIVILSPTVGEIMTQSEMLISISFINASDKIDIPKTKIYLNNQDVTGGVLFAGDLLILSGDNIPQNLGIGSRLLKIDVYDKEGKLYNSVSRDFRIVSNEAAEEIGSRFKYDGYVKEESRNENFNSASVWYNNIEAEFNGGYNQWKLNGFAYLTSEEKSNLQPYDRYSATIQNGDWLELKVGDAFPQFPNLILDGKRVRGISGSINLGAVNIQATYGQTEREVEGKLDSTYSTDPLRTNVIKIDQLKYGNPYGLVNLGTYSRNIFAIRPSFGSGEHFQFGLSYLHAKDDKNSIEFGAQPQENITFGSDLKIALDDQNILFTSQAAVSVVNSDISTGTISDTQIDSLFGPNKSFNVDPAQVKKIKNIIDKFITVNQFLGPWNPQDLSSFAADAALSLNYFDNQLRGSYIYRGNDFQSFGQSFIRTDVKGYNFVDRFRMIDNKLFISLGYENLQDNLQKTKVATTTFKTLSASVSFFPRMDFPNITIGYNRYDNNNGLSVNLPDTNLSKNSVADVTNRFMMQCSYDFKAYVRQSASFSFTTSDRVDNGASNSNAKFNSTSLNINSYWSPQLTSNFGLLYSTSEISGIPFDYVSLSFGGSYKLLDNKLQLSANLSPSFGDYKRQVIELVANYYLLYNLNLIFQTRIYNIPGSPTNSIVGLTTRLSI